MAISNTIVMIQAGFPTGVCVVRSRREYYKKAKETLSDKKIGHSPRGRPPEPHFFDIKCIN